MGVINSFEQILEKLKVLEKKPKVAVVCAQDEHTLEAVLHAADQKIIEPVLIGNCEAIENVLKSLGKTVENLNIIHEEDAVECARKAAALVQSGEAQCIMKGKLETATLMKTLLAKENGLRTGRLMSLVAFMEIPTYHKVMAVTDVGLNTYPSFEDKKQILENAVDIFNSLGVEQPKVGVMASVETVSAKMQETVDADMLKQMWGAGEIKNCIVEGPISYDLAISSEAAAIKGYKSDVAGDVDIMLVPNIVSGNLLAKSLVYSGNSRTAGIIVGSKVPIVITSRSASADDKFMSLALAALAGSNLK